MNSCIAPNETRTLSEWVEHPGFSATADAAARGIARLEGHQPLQDCLRAFGAAVQALGADAGVFISCLRDDQGLTSHRLLPACRHEWSTLYHDRDWHRHDPWLAHAMRNTEATRSSGLVLDSDAQREFVALSRSHGFCSVLICPAPSISGHLRVGMLALGSARDGYFDDPAYPDVRMWARLLAMELHRYVQLSVRHELLIQSRLTAADIDLLRHVALGHRSKHIARDLGIEDKTINCRFQRVIRKLEVKTRRDALRLARLWGLLDGEAEG